MRRDPFKDQPDMADYPECVVCVSYCPSQTPWRDSEGKITIRCGNAARRELFMKHANKKEDK